MGVHRKRRSPEVTINVSAESIEKAKRRDSSHCMIAEAVAACIPSAKNISVDLQTIRWTDPDKQFRYTYLTPRFAQAALIDFDQGVSPKPFSFKLARGQVSMSHIGYKKRKGAVDVERHETLGPRSLKPNAADGSMPEVIGGRPPPRGTLNVTISDREKTAASGETRPYAYVSRRREFGLRALRP